MTVEELAAGRMTVEELAAGRCWVGTHKTTITEDRAYAMAGYSWGGPIGKRAADEELYARALYVNTGTSEVALCFVDMMSASLRLTQEVAAALQTLGHDALSRVFVLSGTHTHTAPGNYFGNTFYDAFAQEFLRAPQRGFQVELTRRLADGIARAIVQAKKNAERGSLHVQRAKVWGASRNRSQPAHLANFQGIPANERVGPGYGPGAPSGLDATQLAVDPRITTLTAVVGARAIGVFAMFGCHATSLGPKCNQYSRDWPGSVVDRVERELLTGSAGAADGKATPLVAAFAQGAGGDVSPLPVGDDKGAAQGPALRAAVADKLWGAICECARAALAAPVETELELELTTGIFRPEAPASEPRWMIGVPVLGGAEDGRSIFYELGFVREGAPAREDGSLQSPKVPALGIVQELLTDVALDVAAFHPWHRLSLGSRVIFTVPGEPTVMAAFELERRVLEATGKNSASVLGYTADYAGYFTTAAEYERQHYEGAHTIYGKASLELYASALIGAGAGIPALTASDAVGSDLDVVAARSLDQLKDVAWRIPAPGARLSVLFGAQANEAVERVALVIPTDRGGRRRVPGNAKKLAGAGDEATALYEASFELGGEKPTSSGERASNERAFGELGPILPHGMRLELNGQERDVLAKAGVLAHPFDALEARRDTALPHPLYLFVCSALASFSLAIWLASAPEPLLAWLGIQKSSTALMLCRMHALGFVLVAVNLYASRHSRDARALLGYAVGTSFLSMLVAGFAYQATGDARALGGLAILLIFSVFGLWVVEYAAEQPRVNPNAWRFTPALEWVGLLTAAVGAVLLIAPGWLLGLLDAPAHDVALLLRTYGALFVLNTAYMWGARHTRELSVVRGQLLGSLVMDGLTTLLLVFGVGEGALNAWGFLLAVPYAIIVLGFLPLLVELRRLADIRVARPRDERELIRLLATARELGQAVRVMGSRHSVARAIHTDRFPELENSRAPNPRGVDISLEDYSAIVYEDRALGRICVQAGMHIGPSPENPDSVTNNLIWHLRQRGLALPDLGGITHQTVSGFLAMGCAGGSLRHAFSDSVVAIRFIDGTGKARTAYRDRDAELFDAVGVSLGLLGVISEITFQCLPSYDVQGEQTTLRLDGKHFSLDGVAHALDDSEHGVLSILKESEYCRMLWWPQPGVNKLSIWRGARSQPQKKHRALTRVPLQELAGRVLQFFGRAYGTSDFSVFVAKLRPRLLPLVINLFQKEGTQAFNDTWDRTLPMDNGVDDYFLPTEFTELWIPLERTPEVLRALFEHYQKNGWDAAGNFSCEIYAARKAPFWMSAACGRDVVRIDIFWFARNAGDPSQYFDQFWQLLEPFGFCAHWAKYLPYPGSSAGAAYVRKNYSNYERFLRERELLDPEQIFVTEYWRRQLAIG